MEQPNCWSSYWFWFYSIWRLQLCAWLLVSCSRIFPWPISLAAWWCSSLCCLLVFCWTKVRPTTGPFMECQKLMGVMRLSRFHVAVFCLAQVSIVLPVRPRGTLGERTNLPSAYWGTLWFKHRCELFPIYRSMDSLISLFIVHSPRFLVLPFSLRLVSMPKTIGRMSSSWASCLVALLYLHLFGFSSLSKSDVNFLRFGLPSLEACEDTPFLLFFFFPYIYISVELF